MQNRLVKITSLSFHDHPVEDILGLVAREAQAGCDILMLPEMWTGEDVETLEGGTTARLRQIARDNGVYIINAVYRSGAKHPRLNSSILIGRAGENVGIYDKMYPYWPEFDLDPPVAAGLDAPVFETDFGRVGLAICFDVNFPAVWERLAQGGADIVFWSSAYSAGSALQAHALTYHYSIVTATLVNDCAVYDITGRETYYSKVESGVLVSRVEVDTNRAIFHENFNMDKKDALLRDHPMDAVVEAYMNRESWFVLKGLRGTQIKALAREYGLETLRDYKRRSREQIDARRG